MQGRILVGRQGSCSAVPVKACISWLIAFEVAASTRDEAERTIDDFLTGLINDRPSNRIQQRRGRIPDVSYCVLKDTRHFTATKSAITILFAVGTSVTTAISKSVIPIIARARTRNGGGIQRRGKEQRDCRRRNRSELSAGSEEFTAILIRSMRHVRLFRCHLKPLFIM
jgi:hypothetical protein